MWGIQTPAVKPIHSHYLVCLPHLRPCCHPPHHTHTHTFFTMSTKPSTTEPTQSTLLSAERRIPGFLGTQTQRPSSKRSRNKSKKVTATDEAPAKGDVGIVGNEGLTSATGELGGTGVLGESEDELVAEEKKTSAVEATIKRIRAANKKIVSQQTS